MLTCTDQIDNVMIISSCTVALYLINNIILNKFKVSKYKCAIIILMFSMQYDYCPQVCYVFRYISSTYMQNPRRLSQNQSQLLAHMPRCIRVMLSTRAY